MWLYFLGIAKTSCSSFILPQEAFFFHCLLLLERFTLAQRARDVGLGLLLPAAPRPLQSCLPGSSGGVQELPAAGSPPWTNPSGGRFMPAQSPLNPTRSTRRWTAAARRPARPRWRPPPPRRSHRGRSRTVPLPRSAERRAAIVR